MLPTGEANREPALPSSGTDRNRRTIREAEQKMSAAERRALLPPKIKQHVRECAFVFGVTEQAIMSKSQVGETSRARRAVIQRLVLLGYSSTQIGRWLGLDHSTVIYHKGQPAATPRFKDLPKVTAGPVPVPDLSGEWAI